MSVEILAAFASAKPGTPSASACVTRCSCSGTARDRQGRRDKPPARMRFRHRQINRKDVLNIRAMGARGATVIAGKFQVAAQTLTSLIEKDGNTFRQKKVKERAAGNWRASTSSRSTNLRCLARSTKICCSQQHVSAAQRALDEAGRLRTLDHLTALTSGQSSARQIRPRPSADRESMVRKIRALARAMNLPDRYLDGMSKKMFHVERYEWCNPDQLHRLVAALEYHRRRIQRKPA